MHAKANSDTRIIDCIILTQGIFNSTSKGLLTSISQRMTRTCRGIGKREVPEGAFIAELAREGNRVIRALLWRPYDERDNASVDIDIKFRGLMIHAELIEPSTHRGVKDMRSFQ